MDQSDESLLNIAATCPATTVLGPGLRAIVWVQGCPFNCHGCISQDWVAARVNRLVDPAQLALDLLENPHLSGITLSGGEPMEQASGLLRFVQTVKAIRDLDIICYTGYRIENLLMKPAAHPVHALLAQVDVLIDGPYVQGLNDNQGLRGSSNQRVHHLSNRLQGYDFTSSPRNVEVWVRDGELLLAGVPPRSMSAVIEDVFEIRIPEYAEVRRVRA